MFFARRSLLLYGLVATSLCATSVRADTPDAPQHLPPGAPRLRVIDTHHASQHAARGSADGVAPQLVECIRAARAVDPVGLAAQSAAVAVVHVRADGAADAVEITPSNLAHGLSACMANVLLQWRQPGVVGTEARVALLVNLAL